jgi:uncharacterized membrane protein
MGVLSKYLWIIWIRTILSFFLNVDEIEPEHLKASGVDANDFL